MDTIEALRAELERTREAIRKHRDAKGHARCWEDDAELYAVLPEGNTGDQTLPPKGEFLAGCSRYYELRRQHGSKITCVQCEGVGCDACGGTGHRLDEPKKGP